MEKKRAIILLSGGLDSATCLAIAKSKGFECYCISFDYGQRHHFELECAKKIAKFFDAKEHSIIDMNLALWGGSALTDNSIDVPNAEESKGIPVTYVPARNLVFLAIASSYAEAINSRDIFIGVNSVDYSGYPDCRPKFIEAFKEVARLGTRAVDENWAFEIHAPLQNLSKEEIIKKGTDLGVDYSITVSCYNANEEGKSCGKCASCVLRHEGFLKAGVQDPTDYSE